MTYDEYKLILKKLKNNGLELRNCDYKTNDFIIPAIMNNGLAIDYVPNPSIKLNKMAIKQNLYALQFVINQPYDLCLSLVKNNGLLLKYVIYQSTEICIEAVKQNWKAIYLIRNDKDGKIKNYGLYQNTKKTLKNATHISEKIFYHIIKQNWEIIKYIPQSNYLCTIAMRQNIDAFDLIKNKTNNMCIEALKHNIELYKSFEKYTDEINIALIENDYKKFNWIKNPSEKVCNYAVEINGGVLFHIPKENQTLDICVNAIENINFSVFGNIKFKFEIAITNTNYRDIKKAKCICKNYENYKKCTSNYYNYLQIHKKCRCFVYDSEYRLLYIHDDEMREKCRKFINRYNNVKSSRHV